MMISWVLCHKCQSVVLAYQWAHLDQMLRGNVTQRTKWWQYERQWLKLMIHKEEKLMQMEHWVQWQQWMKLENYPTLSPACQVARGT